MPLKIYKVDTSPPARAVLMAAELLKLNYVQQEVDMQAGEHLSPEYLEKNPLHSVPLLEDGDLFIADSHAIITYLVSKYGAGQRATLYPHEFSSRAIIDQRLFFDNSILFPTSKRIVQAMMSEGMATPTQQHLEEMYDAYGVMEKYLQKTKFLAADHLTIADVSCVASISSANLLMPVDDKYPKLKAWLSTLEQESWYERVNLQGLNKMKEFMKSIGIQPV